MSDHDEGDGVRTPRRAGISAIADATHTSRQRAAALLKAAGKRRAKRDGTYVFDEAVATILALLDPARSVGHVAGGDDSALSDGVGHVAILSGAKAGYEIARTRKMEISVAQIEGRLVDREAVIALAKDAGAHVKANVLAVPAKVAANCIGKDADEIQRILAEALRDALIRLTDVGDYLLGTAPS